MKTINELVAKKFHQGKVVIPTLERDQQRRMSEADLTLFFETYKNEILNAVFSQGLDGLGRNKNIFVARADSREKSFIVVKYEDGIPYSKCKRLTFVADDEKLISKLDIYSKKIREYYEVNGYSKEDNKGPRKVYNSIK